MIDIKTISGEILVSVPILSDAVKHEELMTSDYIALAWSSDNGDILPAGAYIEYEGERYSLLEPYTPVRVSEMEFRYSPQFQSRVMSWDRQPACVYTYEEDGVTVKSREFDWSFVGSPADAMQIIRQTIKNETGEEWSIMISDSLPSTVEITAQALSILSVLSDIASQCNTEYWTEKENNILHLSKCEHGDAVVLKVGETVGVPSIATSGAEYYTRYYALGSTRNIAQNAANISGSLNRRLTLDPKMFPYGYKDIKGHYEDGVFVSDLEQGEVFAKVVIFDDIYPSSDLQIYDVRPRMKYKLDGGNRVVTGGTSDNPVYEQYAIWYFKIKDFSFSKDLLIEGLPLSVHFKSGRLAGQEFELIYHDEAKTEKTEGDVLPFNVETGDYEIKFKESSGVILPDIGYIIPQDGNEVVLFNIELPSEYTKAAQSRLLEELDKRIQDEHSDKNSYEVNSNPVVFYEEGINLSVGRRTKFVNGNKDTDARVLMVDRRLDNGSEQKLRIGSDIIKGSTKELRENVESLNKNIDVQAAFNDLSKSIQDSYARSQASLNELLAVIAGLWRLDGDTLFTEFNVVSKKNIVAEKEISAGGAAAPEEGGAGLDEEELQDYLDEKGYITETEVDAKIAAVDVSDQLKDYATKKDVDDRFEQLIGEAPEALDTLKEIADALKEDDDVAAGIISEVATVKGQVALHTNAIASLGEKNTEQDTAIGQIQQKDEEQDNDIDGIKTRLDAAEKITSLFGEDEKGVFLKNSKNFYTRGEISAGGAASEGGGEGGDVVVGGSLDSLEDVDINEIEIDSTLSAAEKEAVTESQVLSYDSKGVWVNKTTMYIHRQQESAKVWEITHNMNKMPNVKVIDAYGELVFGTIKYDLNNLNRLEIHFGGAFSGRAYLD